MGLAVAPGADKRCRSERAAKLIQSSADEVLFEPGRVAWRRPKSGK